MQGEDELGAESMSSIISMSENRGGFTLKYMKFKLLGLVLVLDSVCSGCAGFCGMLNIGRGIQVAIKEYYHVSISDK